jgi:hypothetical protein
MICETKELLRRLNESGLLAFDNPQSEQLKSSIYINQHTGILHLIRKSDV